ncbi:MAG TPA: ECF-type sigma factor [Pyrinomonadaceae bacterium]|nr:ECF-type sigma factor [Pyrinomonadaceae bacterium]
MHEITELLHAWKSGDKEALDRLMPLVDPELKKLAHNYMRKERPGSVLQTTALIHEALIRLIKEKVRLEDRNQFYGFAAKRMRQVLIDYANKQQAAKRGNRPQQVDLVEVEELSEEKSKELVRLDEALAELAKEDERQVAIIEYRFFIGLSIEETATVMGLSPRTVVREWQAAQAWLKLYMTTSGNE